MSKRAAENPPPKLSSSLVDYERRIAVNSSISVHGTFTRTMFFGRTFGGNLRVQKALENFRESKRHGLFLHLGESSQDSIDCEALPDSEQPDAMLGTPLAFEPGRKRPRLISNVFFEQQSPKPEVPPQALCTSRSLWPYGADCRFRRPRLRSHAAFQNEERRKVANARRRVEEHSG